MRGSARRAPSAVVAEYAVAYDGRGEVTVEASSRARASRFALERGAEPFVSGFEYTTGTTWTRGTVDGHAFLAPGCAAGACRIRYRFALRTAARRIDRVDTASEEGEVLEAPPSTWLLAPEGVRPEDRLRFHVTTPEGIGFATGTCRAGDGWEITFDDLYTTPYSAFGPMRTRVLDVPGAKIELAITPGALLLDDEALAAWTLKDARAVAAYFGAFPVPEALVLLVPSRGRWIGEGKTLAGGGGAILLRIGEVAPARAYADDWVLVHEMIHLAFPSVPREQDWAEEGLATYVEPIARARAGLLSPEDVWLGLVRGLPNGLPRAGDRGLDQTPTWGRTYWGGALFWLLADLEIRKRTQNGRGLEHALRGILAAGGNNTHRWALADALHAGDVATGLPVLTELHAAMGSSPHPVDLERVWRELGVVPAGRTVRLVDDAPLALVRAAITAR